MICDPCLGGRHTRCTDKTHCTCTVCRPPRRRPPPKTDRPASPVPLPHFDPRLSKRELIPELVLELTQMLADEVSAEQCD